MPKSRIGPFALEAPMSVNKPTGQVFRAIHLEQRKLAALRIFSVPMGMTPESRQAFADQLEELKAFRHPRITRCYGGGFDSRKAYLAHELVDGESLDQMLARRDRLPWETALEYAQQIVEALQYAHERGWVHGNLKPDKILIDSNGVKVCDFRRGEISSMIDAGKRGDDHYQICAPEIFDGQPYSEKGDLYAVGVLMYSMLTGFPPFAGEGESLVATIRQVPAPDVSATALDCPVWLSAIINQLLHKNPAQRPYSTTALQLAFKEAERRQAQGVGVLQHATAGFSPLQLQADRSEAEKVLGIKPEKKKKRKTEEPISFFDQAWVLLLGLVGAVAAIVWFLLPPSESALRRRAEKLLPPTTDQWLDWNTARDGYLAELVERFPDTESATWAQAQTDWVNARDLERRLKRDHRLNRDSQWSDAERQYWSATDYEQFGDNLSAKQRYEALVNLYTDDPEADSVLYLAQEGLARIEKETLEGSVLTDFITQMLEEAQAAYDRAKIDEARMKWEAIVTLYADSPDLAQFVEEAQAKLDKVRSL